MRSISQANSRSAHGYTGTGTRREGGNIRRGKESQEFVSMLHFLVDVIVAHQYPDLVKACPAHLHINVLSAYQSWGFGNKTH